MIHPPDINIHCTVLSRQVPLALPRLRKGPLIAGQTSPNISVSCADIWLGPHATMKQSSIDSAAARANAANMTPLRSTPWVAIITRLERAQRYRIRVTRRDTGRD